MDPKTEASAALVSEPHSIDRNYKLGEKTAQAESTRQECVA